MERKKFKQKKCLLNFHRVAIIFPYIVLIILIVQNICLKGDIDELLSERLIILAPTFSIVFEMMYNTVCEVNRKNHRSILAMLRLVFTTVIITALVWIYYFYTEPMEIYFLFSPKQDNTPSLYVLAITIFYYITSKIINYCNNKIIDDMDIDRLNLMLIATLGPDYKLQSCNSNKKNKYIFTVEIKHKWNHKKLNFNVNYEKSEISISDNIYETLTNNDINNIVKDVFKRRNLTLKVERRNKKLEEYQ